MKCPHCLKEIHHKRYISNRIKRIELIMKTINYDNVNTIDILYKIVRRKGYSMRRRTFERDIKLLELNRKINLTKVKKDGGGYKLIITKNDNI